MKYERTSRLTSPEPTGYKKILQDEWDEKREEQCRSVMTTYNTINSIRNWWCAILEGVVRMDKEIELAKAEGKEYIRVLVMGSYIRTDKYDGEDCSDKNENILHRYITRTGKLEDQALKINKILKEKNIIALTRGIRETGSIWYKDGTFDVVSPTKGIQINAEKAEQIDKMETIETYYIVLLKQV